MLFCSVAVEFSLANLDVEESDIHLAAMATDRAVGFPHLETEWMEEWTLPC